VLPTRPVGTGHLGESAGYVTVAGDNRLRFVRRHLLARWFSLTAACLLPQPSVPKAQSFSHQEPKLAGPGRMARGAWFK